MDERLVRQECEPAVATRESHSRSYLVHAGDGAGRLLQRREPRLAVAGVEPSDEDAESPRKIVVRNAQAALRICFV